MRDLRLTDTPVVIALDLLTVFWTMILPATFLIPWQQLSVAVAAIPGVTLVANVRLWRQRGRASFDTSLGLLIAGTSIAAYLVWLIYRGY